MSTIKKNFGSIFTSLVEILIGILLLINPVGFTSGIIIALGVVSLIGGIADIIRYFRTNAVQAASEQWLARGLVGAVIGAFCILRSKWFILTFPVLAVLYGVVNLVMGIFKVQLTVDAIRMKGKWGWLSVSAALTLLLAAVILLNPFSSTVVLWIFTGVTLIVEAVIDAVSIIFSNRKKKQIVSEE